MNNDVTEAYSNCRLCPRSCGVNRAAGERGYCGQTAQLFAARAGLHFWEEPCISGAEGSGTVFFSGCNLRCIYCQNRQIALGDQGQPITTTRLTEIFFELQKKGANNINLVTPTHYVPHIREALLQAKKQGFTLPIVYNTSGYEEVSTLRTLEGLIDVYLPDLKYRSAAPGARFSNAPDYFEKASAALSEMYRQVGDPVFDPATGLMRRGMIIRHLLLPDGAGEAKRVLRYIHETFGDHVYVSIMNQYTPMPQIHDLPQFQDIDRSVTKEEYERVLDFADKIGISLGYLQEGDTAKESFIPPFTGEGL
ncbi:MAG: radical SAM protein [Lachnospiraceae bacterium]|nr:radical SAM protein [Lachnospiraceae bacterium]